MLCALSVVSDARPAGAGRSVSLPVLPAGSFGPLAGAGFPDAGFPGAGFPGAGFPGGLDYDLDPLESLASDPMGSMGKLLLGAGGGGGGGSKKLLIIG